MTTNKELSYLEYEVSIRHYEKEMYGTEAPSTKYRRADRLRHKDLAYELGGYNRVAPTIEPCCDSANEFRHMVNEFRKRQGWEEYI